jgi:hypothetical protein
MAQIRKLRYENVYRGAFRRLQHCPRGLSAIISAAEIAGV